MIKPAPSNQGVVDALIAKIRKNPELAAKVAPLFDIASSNSGMTADQAEAEIQRRIAALASETLGSWAQSTANASAVEAAKDGATKHSKKK
jgi:hypothetical protein